MATNTNNRTKPSPRAPRVSVTVDKPLAKYIQTFARQRRLSHSAAVATLLEIAKNAEKKRRDDFRALYERIQNTPPDQPVQEELRAQFFAAIRGD